MSLFELLLLLVVAALCGSIAQALAGFSRGGCLVSIAVGFIGALLGSRLSQMIGLPEPFVVTIGGRNLPLVWSIVGGAIFVAALGLMTRGGSAEP